MIFSQVLSEYVVMRECIWILMSQNEGFLFKENQKGLFDVRSFSLHQLSQVYNIIFPFYS